MSGFQPFLNQDPYSSKVYNVDTNHPLIPNSQLYNTYKKYISIHSEDRDCLKYPQSNSFEIELPEDLLNIFTVRLVHWTFPANYDTFSPLYSNVSMTFKINNPYNPGAHGLYLPLYEKIYECLFLSQSDNFYITIEKGFYNPSQMTTELTNKFNYAVTERIKRYFAEKGYTELLELFEISGGYNNFNIVYNAVTQNIWFGNTSDGFILTNTFSLVKTNLESTAYCSNFKSQLPDFSNWGLPGNLGLPKCDTESTTGAALGDLANLVEYKGIIVPRFFYGDVNPGDNGYWLLPNPLLVGSHVHWVTCPFKINFMGPAYMYLEVQGLNCIDETSPYDISSFTLTTNQTNGIVNSSFAKIPIPTTPISQWFDRDSYPYKEFLPPAERMRKLSIKLRYHNGQLVDLGLFDYSIMFEFLLLQPQQGRSYKAAYSTS